MALEKLRRRWERALGPMLKIASNVSPITITWLALPFGVAGGLLAMYAPDESAGGWWMFGAALMIGLAMIFDGLDGSLARAKGQVTRWGDYLDHTIDRILDSTWVVCISASLFVNDLALGFAAALLTLLGSYMGTQAQAVAGTRNYRGFSRADRTVLTLLSLVAMGIMLLADISITTTYPAPFDHISINPLSFIVFISALGGIWTFLIRFKQAQGDIQAIDEADPLPQPNIKKQDE
ncbi:MAG TPA: CDP-alcohol phosphatidyltransferase family protein [Poseidonia sp.]|nr:CDP-alcohol phosphatidyltransferase family protein [Poseidonia sp.]